MPGFNTTLFYNTELHTTVVVETNSDIPTGDCPPDTPTLTDGPHDIPCADPAVRINLALAKALGKPFTSSR